MLGRCSASTMYRRFHGLTDGRAHAVEVLRGGPDQDAYGAWSGDRCIGLASLALDSDASTHIGVLVEDGWQRRGAGTALMVTLVHRARERRLSSLVADVLADNQFILSLLARVGPITTAVVPGGYRIRISLTGEGHGRVIGVLHAASRHPPTVTPLPAAGQHQPTGAGGIAGEPGSNGATAPLQVGGVRIQMEVPVGGQQGPFQLEGELPGIAVGAELPFARASSAAAASASIHCSWHSAMRSRTGPAALQSNSAMAEAKKQPPGKHAAFDVGQK